MIRVDTRALLALYDRRLDLASGINAAHAEDAAVGGVNAVARVEALLSDGQFRATVANQILSLNLPASTRVGDQVPVRLVDGNWVPASTAAPRLTAAAPAQVGSGQAATEAFSTRLSPSLRLLAEILEPSTNPALRPTLGSNQALLTQPPQNATLLAQALRSAIGESGLFYEAHQAQWLSGARSLAELRGEPQGRLTPLPALAALSAAPLPTAAGAAATWTSSATPLGAAATSASLTLPPAAEPSGPSSLASSGTPDNNAALPIRGAERPDATSEYREIAALTTPGGAKEANGGDALASNEPSVAANKAAETTPRPAGPNIHPDALPLVRQQLEVLEQPVLAWRGEFWPGQPGEIELREDRPASTEPDAERVFATRLSLELPRLGAVEAVLQISGKHLQVRLHGERDDSATEMGASLADLQAMLAALGLDLDELRVFHGQA